MVILFIWKWKTLSNVSKPAFPLSFRLYFQIGLHIKDEYILQLIQSELGVGKIYKTKSRPDSVELQVTSLKDLHVIIKYFDKYPLITQKLNDYKLFKEAYELILNKKHLTFEGLMRLIEIKALNNKGLTEDLKKTFQLDQNIILPKVNETIKSPGWLSGFTSGEGSFQIVIGSSSSSSTGYQVRLKFQITQLSRDRFLMEQIIKYLGCGYISERKDVLDFHVIKFNDIIEKVIPFFEKYPIIGVKSLNFKDFCKAAEIMKNKEHLTDNGLNKIKKIRLGMNTFRNVD